MMEIRDKGSESSNPSRALKGRNLHREEFSNLLEVPSYEEVMTDLLDHTRKYIFCEDPIESAARQQRVHKGEERDMMKETAISIIRSAENNLVAHLNQIQQGLALP